ncbi:hypothetical protein MRX96_027938 [Rhipicephalus microplus]
MSGLPWSTSLEPQGISQVSLADQVPHNVKVVGSSIQAWERKWLVAPLIGLENWLLWLVAGVQPVHLSLGRLEHLGRIRCGALHAVPNIPMVPMGLSSCCVREWGRQFL